MRAGRKGESAVRVLLDDGARHGVLNKRFRRPSDVAGAGFNFDGKKTKHGRARAKIDALPALQERRSCRANLLSTAPSARTLVLHHPECNEHIPKSEADWECPDRIQSILTKLTEPNECRNVGLVPSNSFNHTDQFRFPPREITVSTEFDRASLELISRVHSAEYLSFVNELSKTLEQKTLEENGKNNGAMASIPFTPHVRMYKTYLPE